MSTIYARGQVTIVDLNDAVQPNLLDHTDVDTWGVGYWEAGIDGGVLEVVENAYEGKSCIRRFVQNETLPNTCSVCYRQSVHVKYGAVYTLSALVKCSQPSAKLAIEVSKSGSTRVDHYQVISRVDLNVADSWRRIRCTFSIGREDDIENTDDEYTVSFVAVSSTAPVSSSSDGVEVLFLEPKLEEGAFATDWCLSENDKKGVSGYTIIAEPSSLYFSSNDKGIVTEDTKRREVVLRVLRGAEDATRDAVFGDPINATRCTAVKKPGAFATYYIASIEISSFTTLTDTYRFSANTGYFDIPVTIEGNSVNVRITFNVNTSAFFANQEMTAREFRSTYDEFVGDVTSLAQYRSEIIQTAREISLTVKKDILANTNNLITGTDAKRSLPDHFSISSRVRICTTERYSANNSFECVASNHENEGVTWGGDSGIRVQPGRQYTLSCFVKANRICTADRQGNSFVISINSIPHSSVIAPQPFDIPVVDTWLFLSMPFTVPLNCEKITISTDFVSDDSITGHICDVMLEEGGYSRWGLSSEDTYYVGANLLNGTKNMTENVVNTSYLTDEYYNDCRVINAIAASSRVPMYRFVQPVTEMSSYVLSFWAKGSGKAYVSVLLPGSGGSLILETNEGATDRGITGIGKDIPVSASWRRVWAHVYFPLGRADLATFAIQAGVNSSLDICGVKLEEGATATEYTERKTTLSFTYDVFGELLATGINIRDREITLTADKTLVRDNKGVEIAMFSEGKLSARLIDVSKLLAGEIEADKAILKNVNIGEDAYVQSALHIGNTFTYRQVHTIPESFLNNIDDYRISALRESYPASEWNQNLNANGLGTEIFIYTGSRLLEGTFDIDAYPKFVFDDVTLSRGYWYVKTMKGERGIEMGYQLPEVFRSPYVRSYNTEIVSQLGELGLEIASVNDKDFVASSLRLHNKPTVTVTNHSITISGMKPNTSGDRSLFSIYVDETDGKLYLKYQNYVQGSRYQSPSIMDFESLWTKLLAL